MTNLLSGFFGALLGALGSFLVAIYVNKKAVCSLTKERFRNQAANGVVLAGRLLDYFHSYRPDLLNQSSVGMRIQEESLARMQEASRLYDEGKYFEHLLPQELRKRWDSMLLLISDYSRTESLASWNKNRAMVDVQTYIKYVRDSLVNYLDDKYIGEGAPHPYLKRDDSESWVAPSLD